MRVFRNSKEPDSPEVQAETADRSRIARRPLIGGSAALALGLLSSCTSKSEKPVGATVSESAASESTTSPKVRIYLLGTGGPELSTTRQGMSTLIEAGGRRFLFDAGRGATQNMYECRVHPKEVTKVFLTHLHNDHYEDLPSLWLNPWFMYGRKEKLEVWGPPGTAGMVKGMREMYEHDVKHRANDLFKREYLDVRVREVEPGVVYDSDGVKVTAFTVEHHDGNPAYGFRFDYAGKSVLLSGDTTYEENVVSHGTNVDVLIHNVVACNEEITKSGRFKAVEAKLTTPEQAARVFSKARPRAAVFSHIVKKGLHGGKGDKVILDRTRKAGYSGPLHMGLDRMTIDIGDEVVVKDPIPTDHLPDLDGLDVQL